MKCEKLDVWKIGARLASDTYKATKNLKDYGFKDQITKSALSIPSNITEGMEKESDKDKIRFLDIAKSSTAEFITQAYIGIDIEYLKTKETKELIKTANKILGMLTNLQYNLRGKNNDRQT